VTFPSVAFMSFGPIFAAELGDKTQIMVFGPALRYGARPVPAGAGLAFALLSGSAAVIGRGFAELLPEETIAAASGWVFILFGLFLLLRKEPGDETRSFRQPSRAGLLAAFSLIALSETGDKTRVATLLLSVKYQSFPAVLLGSFAALMAATLLGVFIAGKVHRFIPRRLVAPLSGILFILAGFFTLILF